VELFGKNAFPAIQALPYFLSLGPHSFYWFYLTPIQATADQELSKVKLTDLPVVEIERTWEQIFQDNSAERLEEVLPVFLTRSRWFGGKARPLKQARIVDVFALTNGVQRWYILLVNVDYLSGDAETYVIPLSLAHQAQAQQILKEHPGMGIANLKLKGQKAPCLLYDAATDSDFGHMLLELLDRKRIIRGRRGYIRGSTTVAFRRLKSRDEKLPAPVIMKAEQSNTSLRFGDRLILKLIRRVTSGINPDLEIGRLLTEKRFPHSAPVAGGLELQANQSEPMTIAILQGFVSNQGDAWSYTLEHLQHFFEDALVNELPALPTASPTVLIEEVPTPEAAGLIGTYLESARLLGRRTAEMHLCLASEVNRPEFKPEPFSKLYQRALYQSMRTLARKALPLLRRQFNRLAEDLRQPALQVLDSEKLIVNRFKALLERKITAMRIRCHGDYHLGQVLYTGRDFIIIDFEGEPARPITERRIKRSALRDVAGMLRSFHYAAYASAFRQQKPDASPDQAEHLEHWAEFWQRWVSAEFLKSYLQEASGGQFIPNSWEELRVLTDTLLLEKAVYELAYELNNRPDWVKIPLYGIRQLLNGDGDFHPTDSG